jgi:hypothetical protein
MRGLRRRVKINSKQIQLKRRNLIFYRTQRN